MKMDITQSHQGKSGTGNRKLRVHFTPHTTPPPSVPLLSPRHGGERNAPASPWPDPFPTHFSLMFSAAFPPCSYFPFSFFKLPLLPQLPSPFPYVVPTLLWHLLCHPGFVPFFTSCLCFPAALPFPLCALNTPWNRCWLLWHCTPLPWWKRSVWNRGRWLCLETSSFLFRTSIKRWLCGG